MLPDDNLIKEYVKDRDDAITRSITEDSLEPFKSFVNKWQARGIYPPCFSLPSDEVLKITVNKMAIHATKVDKKTKEKACYWLLSHGYDLNLD